MTDSAPCSSAETVHNSSRSGALKARTAIPALIAAIACGSCAGSGYKAANYSPEKLATPAHNMSQREYPFDDKGRYRPEWVTGGSTRSSGSSASRSSSSSGSSSATTAQRTTTTASAPRTTAAPPKPKPQPKPAARYHTVTAGQTLWAISQKYGVSVSALKSANGLSSDLIRVGQSLRIP